MSPIEVNPFLYIFFLYTYVGVKIAKEDTYPVQCLITKFFTVVKLQDLIFTMYPLMGS